MSYSRRQLYAMGEPLGDGATRRAVGGKVIYGSGGGGGSAEKQTTIVDLPEWAKPYAKESLGKAAALTSTPYQTYGGERTAQFNPLQKQAFQSAAQQQVAGQVGQATGLAGLASQQALGAGDFQTGVFDAERVGTSSFAQPGEASRFMSPYMDAVVQRQMESAQRQADIAGTQRGAQAVRAGAFGGSRQAVENAEAARALASQKGEIQAQGLQSAFQQAQSQFNQEQDARMRAAMANQQAGFEAQRATEQSRQFGSNIGLQGAQTALQGAGQLGQLGQQQFGQQMGITDLQQQLGGQQRAATQEILSSQYQDFLNQQRAPYDQLSFMSSIIRGTPMGQTTAQYQPAASPTSQLLGLATAGAGAYGAYQGAQGRAAGGEVKSYATGGIASLNQPEMAAATRGMDDQQVASTADMAGLPGLTAGAEQQRRNELRMAAEGQKAPASMTKITSVLSQMSDAELQQYAKLNKSDPYTMALVVSEANRRKEGGMPTQEAPTVVDQQIAGMALPEDQGIAQLPVGNMDFASGGIVAFQTGNMVPDPVMVDEERKRAAARLNAGIGAPPQVAAPAPVGSGILGDFTRLGETQMAAETAATKSEREGIASYKKFLEDREKKAETYGTPTEERLKKREEEAKGSSKQNIFMTMVDVGLRVAAGESPNALSNIAKGAQQGLKGFQERLDTIKTNKEKLDEDYARLYEIRAEKVDAVGERLSTLKREELSFEADAARRAANIAAAVEGKKIDYKLGKEKSADAFRNATAGSQTPERQAYADLLKKNKGDAVAALTEFNQKFGKKEIDPGVKAGVDFLEKQIGEIMARPVPLPDDEAQIQRIQKRINELKGGGASSAGQPVTTKAQYDALPKGATYVDPNGVTRTKG